MYSLSDYLWMIADAARVNAYASAVRALVRPGDRVLEVGAGFGFFSVLAAHAGAARVDAVETNPAVHLGPKIAAANGCAGTIVFHHLDVRRLQLPERADVLLMDVRGATPFARGSLEVLRDARRRLLKPEGRIIAEQDTVFVAPCRAPAVFRREVMEAHGREGVDLAPVERVVYDTPMRCAVDPGDLLAEGQEWVRLDYPELNGLDHQGCARWHLADGAVIDGLALWFESDLGGGIGLSAAPGTSTAYRQMYIPLREQVTIPAGGQLRLDLAVRAAGEEYVWTWRGWIAEGRGGERLVFDQNSLAERVLDPAALPAVGPDARPVLAAHGRAVHALLSRLDGRHTIAEAGSALAASFPELFPDRGSANRFVSGWIARLNDLERGTSR